MTEKQAAEISKFIDGVPNEVADSMFEELIAGMSVYFGTTLFSEAIDKIYDNLKEKGASIEDIAKAVKEEPIAEEEIYSSLMANLEDEFDAENFAEDCVNSIAFNAEYPKVILDKLKELEIEPTDFSANLIITFKDQFIDFFVNDLDVLEWKNDIIDALVASWD